MRAIIDSDVLIDYLQGLEKAKRELDRYAKREISIISWTEVMTGADTPEEDKDCREFLSTFTVHPLSTEIASEAVEIRRASRLRLPDAFVWATARANGCLLVTRNARDFSPKEPGIRIPYSVP
ncbi:MAG: type II toxin-antitoxin system VapC family toxin [Polyangia bacterium]